MKLLRDMIKEAMDHPGALQRFDGNGDVFQHIPQVPASHRHVSMVETAPVASDLRTLSAHEMRSIQAANENKRSGFLPAGTDAGKVTTLSASVLQNSLVAQAGATIIVVPTVEQTPANSGDSYKFSQHPAAFVTVEAGNLALVADGAEVPLSPLPLHTVALHNAMPSYAVRFNLTRRQLKDLSSVTTDAIWTSLGLGLANKADEVLLTALNSAALGQFTLGTVAARGLRFLELSAVVGTNAAVSAEVAADGALRTHGVCAELTNAIAGTIIGAFNRAAVAVQEQILVQALRTKDGGCQVTAWASMEAVVPDATAFLRLNRAPAAVDQADKGAGSGAEEAAATLPAKVRVLDEAQITIRENGGEPRIIVQFPGCRAFLCGPDGTAAAIDGLWPELTTAQLDMAVTHMARAVKAYVRQYRKANKTSWATRW